MQDIHEDTEKQLYMPMMAVENMDCCIGMKALCENSVSSARRPSLFHKTISFRNASFVIVRIAGILLLMIKVVFGRLLMWVPSNELQ